MNRIITGLLLLVFLTCLDLAAFPASAQTQPADFVHAQGRELHVGQTPLRLQAICFSNYYNKTDLDLLSSNHHSELDFQRVKGLGFNAIRFAMNGNWYENDKKAFWRWLDKNIGWARKHDIRLILDLHVPIASFWLAPNHPETSFALWTDKHIQQRNIALWEAIATRYKDETIIAAYDILNEPVTSDADGTQWRELAQQMVNAIRSIDTNHLIVVEHLYGVNERYGTLGIETQFLVNDPNILYDFHFYEPVEYTHQYAAWLENPIGDGGHYPDNTRLTPTGQQVLLPAARISTSPLSAANTEWHEYNSEIVQLTDSSATAAIPIMTIRGAGQGKVFFDDIRVYEYDQNGQALGPVLHEPVSADSIWQWWSWKSSGMNQQHVTFNRETGTGSNDQHSLSVTLGKPTGNESHGPVGWSNDHHWFRVTPGHYYQISANMKFEKQFEQQADTDETETIPLAIPELDFYTTSVTGEPAFLERNQPYLEHQFMQLFQFGKQHNVPVSVLETGLVRHAFEMEGKGGIHWVRDLLDLFKKHQVSYAWWNYHGDQMGLFLSGQDSPPDALNLTLADTFIELQAGNSELFYRDSLLPAEASEQPPGGLRPDQVPQFVVIGFDDNTQAAGIDWAIDLFADLKNPAGNGNADTYDGLPARTSFYMNTHGLVQWLEDDPNKLVASLKQLPTSGHEVGNHTHNHQADLNQGEWSKVEAVLLQLSKPAWRPRIEQCSELLHSVAGIPRDAVQGFRAPYLKYNQDMFSTLAELGFTYDSSIEEGHNPRFDGRNFRWPYTLHHGSPGHAESWLADPRNPLKTELGQTPELWELPNHVLIIPDDETSLRYGIKPGLWKHIKQRIPHLQNNRMTGFDYNLWVNAALSGQQVTAILKYNLDLRLEGNRAPFMFGAHTQYYTNADWVKQHAPQVSMEEMQQAIREFLEYALSKPAVRVRPARDIISWCRHPAALE